jgi:2-succinyl-6-hydroxy-2,4-cyclohexadiene-1-carboxylate synthase
MPDLAQIVPQEVSPGLVARVCPGPGDPVLWVHGYTIDSTTWGDLWSRLPGWTHLGIDLPGHGGSDPLGPRTTLRDLGEALAEAASRRGVRHVVGLSLGSMIALQVVLARPSAFETLTMAAPALAGGPVESAVGVRYRELYDLYQRRGPGPWMTELWMRSPPETFAYATEELRARLAAIIDQHSWRDFDRPDFGICGFARQYQNSDELTRVAARLLVLIGDRELEAFRKAAAILRGIRPDAQVVELAGVGHLCLLQAPESSARFLAEHWRGPGRSAPATGV